MRRKDREITCRAEMLKIIRGCDVCRVALNDPETGVPYILPLNFGFEEKDGRLTFYFHGALEGRKYELMQNDPRASFELDRGHELMLDEGQGNCTMTYESVIGRGRMALVPEEEKEAALQLLMRQYRSEDFCYNRAVLPATRVFKLTVESMTAKRRARPRG